MSSTSAEPFPASDGTDPAEPTKRRRRPPLWVWIALGVVVALILIGAALFGRGTPDQPAASPSSSASHASPTATSTPPPATEAAGDPDVGQGTFASEMDGYLSDVLFSQNTAVLDEGGTFSDPVFVATATSEPGRNMTPTEAVHAMEGMFTPVDPDPWDLALSSDTLDGYRAGPYGAYFPAGAIVARSHDGHVFAFIGDGDTITTMFMASSESLLH